MTGLALALVLASAVVHASWNLLIKRAGPGASGAAFAWLLSAVSAVVIAPVALWLVATGRVRLTASALLLLAISAALHTVAFRMLQRGYRSGDLSLVYPLARGTGPLVSSVAALAFMGEPVSVAALAGVGLVAGGVFLLTGGGRALRVPAARAGALLGISTGVLIGAYTLWDKHLVSSIAVPPLVIEWTTCIAMTAILTPAAFREDAGPRAVWRAHRGIVLAVALLSSASYVLFLTALATAPVSRVAPARELSILLGTFLGGRVLGEADAGRRLLGAAAMTAGVALLALR